jgi:hypothetical protein
MKAVPLNPTTPGAKPPRRPTSPLDESRIACRLRLDAEVHPLAGLGGLRREYPHVTEDVAAVPFQLVLLALDIGVEQLPSRGEHDADADAVVVVLIVGDVIA